ncbi:MAG: polyprenyl synthetase family protein [Planctomycetota bacterium]
MSELPNLVDTALASIGHSRTRKSPLRQAAIVNPVQDFLGRDGKGIRAELIQTSFQIAGGEGEPPKCVVEFVELLHAGSLVIDDIQDNSRNRRQQETMHLRYGVPLAINTGNWMYFAAIELLAGIDLAPSAVLDIVKKSLGVIKQCHEGQALDLTATFDECSPIELPEVVRTIGESKTGALTALATWLGGVAAGADASVCEQLAKFGMELGIGLQMQNDFVELQKVAVSRCNSDDLRNRRCTWPWAWLAEVYPAEEVQRLAKLAREQLPEPQDAAQQILERIEIVAVNEINQKLEGCLAELNGFRIETDVHEKLNRIVATVELNYV